MPPLDASRKVARAVRFFAPWLAKDGIGLPGLTHEGHFRWAIWKAIPLFLEPSSLRSGAPRL